MSRSSFLAIFALLLPAAALAQAPARADSFTTADGLSIHYTVRGSGTPVVLLHGFSLTGDHNWVLPGTADSLAQFQVIVPDLRGHGSSGKPHDAAAYGAHFQQDVLALLDHLNIRRAHIAGYSMGAMITLQLATAHPERVISAVLGGGGWVRPGASRAPNIQRWLEGLDRIAREGGAVADVVVLPGHIVGDSLRAMLNRNDPAALAAVLRNFDGVAVTEDALRAVRVPLLAVVGDEDPRAREVVEAMRTVVPGLVVTIIPGANHATAIGNPRLAGAIRAFFAEH